MAIAKIQNRRYTVEPLYQWDINQILEIRGLSLSGDLEIHFINETMSEALIQTATIGADGVITAEIPNGLLWKPYAIMAYICVKEGDVFRSLHALRIPVKARPMPGDYVENVVNTLPHATVTITNNCGWPATWVYKGEEAALANGEMTSVTAKIGDMLGIMFARTYYGSISGVSVDVTGGTCVEKFALTFGSGKYADVRCFLITVMDETVNITIT